MIVSSALMIWKGLMVATGSGIVQLFAELERLFSTKICDSNRQQLTLQKKDKISKLQSLISC